MLIGQLAVGAWEPWRLADVPPVSVLARLDLVGIEEVIEQTRTDLQAAIASHRSSGAKLPSPPTSNRRTKNSSQVAYLRIGSTRFDFVQELLRSHGIDFVECAPEDLEIHDSAIVTCLGVPASRFGEYLPRGLSERRLIVTDAHRIADYSPLGMTLGLPASSGTIRSACALLDGEGAAGTAASHEANVC